MSGRFAMSMYTRTISSAWKLEVTHARGASFRIVSINPRTFSAFIYDSIPMVGQVVNLRPVGNRRLDLCDTRPSRLSIGRRMPSCPTSFQNSPQQPLQHRHGLVVIGGQPQFGVLPHRGSYQAKQATPGVFSPIAPPPDNHTRARR